ncbi:Potassium voltage-gated channel subfamily C member 4 [Mactra antiquata]
MEQAVTVEEKGLIRLNIGGTLFLTYTETLACFSGSKLASLDRSTKNYNFNTHEYFFDRNPLLFAYILDACRKGAVHIPKDVCGSTFRQELEFWEISSKYVAPCCWETLYSSDADVYMMQQLFDHFKQNTNMCLMLQQEKTMRGKLWLFLDEPNSSKPAMERIGVVANEQLLVQKLIQKFIRENIARHLELYTEVNWLSIESRAVSSEVNSKVYSRKQSCAFRTLYRSLLVL